MHDINVVLSLKISYLQFTINAIYGVEIQVHPLRVLTHIRIYFFSNTGSPDGYPSILLLISCGLEPLA